jgi:hypothetical protein
MGRATFLGDFFENYSGHLDSNIHLPKENNSSVQSIRFSTNDFRNSQEDIPTCMYVHIHECIVCN